MRHSLMKSARMRTIVCVGCTLGWAAASGVFYSYLMTCQVFAQSPSTMTDADGDGIPDEWEQNGVDVTYPDGTSEHLTLNSSPKHKDIFVFVAWMDGYKHSHKPVASSVTIGGIPVESTPLGRAVDEFAHAPIQNIDEKNGITLHIVYAKQGIPETPELMTLGTTNPDGTIYDWTAFKKVKASVFFSGPPGIESVFHFCLFAHQLGGVDVQSVSGIAESIPGRDFIVSLGNDTDADEEVGTFMHELGHDLNLRHGGLDDVNNKPNYPSVMNYLYQLPGTFRDGVPGHFAYSDVDVPLDETHLIDRDGISQLAALKSYGALHLCFGQPVPISSFNDPVRWDCKEEDPDSSGAVEQIDVNMDKSIKKLLGSNDWKHILLIPGQTASVQLSQEPKTDVLKSQLGALAPAVTASVQNKSVSLKWTMLPLQAVKGYLVTRRSELPGQSLTVPVQSTSNIFTDTPTETGAYSYSVRTVLAFQSDVESLSPANLSPSQLHSKELREKYLFTALSSQLPKIADITVLSGEMPAKPESLGASAVYPLALQDAAGNPVAATLGATSSEVRVTIE